MIFETRVPAPPLDRFIEFLWFYDGFAPLHTREKLLPDASMELIVDLREHPKKLYDTDDPRRATEFRKSWLSGMHTEYIVIDASPGSMMGAHFRPGGAWPFLETPLCEFADAVVPFECVIGPHRATSLRDRLLEAPDFHRKFEVLEAFLLQAGRGKLNPDRVATCALPEVLHRMAGPPVRMKQLAAKLGVSQRHLIHCFEQRVGLRPKQLQRVLRFQQAIRSMGRNRPSEMDWPAVALDCGYYDQSHFIHDFQQFSGHTPVDFLRQQREHDNYIILDQPMAATA